MIEYTTNFTSLCNFYRSFGRYNNNYTTNIQPVITDLCARQNIICECCGRILHKVNLFIIRVPKFLPPSIGKNINQFISIHGDNPNEPPPYCNS